MINADAGLLPLNKVKLFETRCTPESDGCEWLELSLVSAGACVSTSSFRCDGVSPFWTASGWKGREVLHGALH